MKPCHTPSRKPGAAGSTAVAACWARRRRRAWGEGQDEAWRMQDHCARRLHRPASALDLRCTWWPGNREADHSQAGGRLTILPARPSFAENALSRLAARRARTGGIARPREAASTPTKSQDRHAASGEAATADQRACAHADRDAGDEQAQTASIGSLPRSDLTGAAANAAFSSTGRAPWISSDDRALISQQRAARALAAEMAADQRHAAAAGAISHSAPRRRQSSTPPTIAARWR